MERIQPELYPCLFTTKGGDLFVLLERSGDEITFFDARKERTRTQTARHVSGTAYVFTDTHPTHGISSVDIQDEAWFFRLFKRFRHLILHLLAMTFVINGIALAVPLFVMVIYDKVVGTKSLEALPYLLSGIAILMVSDLGLRFLRARLMGSIAGRLDYLIGVETFRQLLFLPPLYTERTTVATQLSHLKQFDSVRDFFTGPNAAVALELPFVFLFTAVIAVIAGPLALIPLVMIAVYVLFGLVWLPNLRNKLMRAGRAHADKQRVLMQTLAGRKEIKAIGNEMVWQERFRETSGEAVMANYKALVTSGIMNSVAQSLMTLAGVAVIGFGAMAVMNDSLSIGALIAVMALVWRILSPLQSAFLATPKLGQVFKSIKQINQLMRLNVERDRGQSGLMLSSLQGHIRVERVSFRFGPDQDPALLGASFSVEAGEILAIAGNTGAGKSTLLKLIAGMYRPQAGSLSIDNQDIRQLNAMDLRRAIAYVPQETRMFHGTIAQNMRLKNPLATDEQLTAAAEDAGILEEILALPQGFDTRIGDSVTDRLPPGFARGLSMARAFVSPAQVVLMDEPGASLDDVSDRKLMNQLSRLKGKRTVIMVTHRPSHIRIADKAVYMEQGSVRLIGSPDEVVALMLEQTK